MMHFFFLYEYLMMIDKLKHALFITPNQNPVLRYGAAYLETE